MSLINSFKMLNEDDYISSKILNWTLSSSKSNILNVISVPYNNSSIFVDTILSIVSRRKKVLYITNEKEEKINILKHIKKKTDFRQYAYVRNEKSYYKDKLLIITNHENCFYINEDFEIVIYDDINSFSNYSVRDIERLLSTRNSKKIITYSIEPIYDSEDQIDIPIKRVNMPFIEPRVITTRIDISKEIPFVLYEYLTWFVSSKRKVVLYVPDEKRLEKVYHCLCNLKEELGNNIFIYNKDKKIENLLKAKDEAVIIIANNMENLRLSFGNLDIVVYFADDESYNYKKLTYICGKAGANDSIGNSEVIFLANSNSEDMDKAKSITRNFNKIAWESGLINI